jgi:uncharacterized membrane protein (DUF373 family)
MGDLVDAKAVSGGATEDCARSPHRRPIGGLGVVTISTGGGLGTMSSKRLRLRVAPRRERAARPLAALYVIEDLVQFVVAAVLIAVAAAVLYQSIAEFVRSDQQFATRVTDVTNGVLFVIIVLEILTTVVAHFDFGGFQLKPFLIIGIISAVRHILTVGAQESLVGAESAVAFRRAQTALGVNAGVVVALVVGLILVRRTDVDDNDQADVD